MGFEILETLRKLSHILVYPLFAVGYMDDHQMLDQNYRLDTEGVLSEFDNFVLAWLLTSSDIRLQVIGWAVVLGILVGVAIFAVWISRLLIAEVDIRFNTPLLIVTGLICMVIGVLFVAGVASGASFTTLNPFWSLGLVCYGWILLELGALLHMVSSRYR